MPTNPTQLNHNTRVSVYGRPGRVQYTAPDGAIAVRLVGERRIDLYSPCQVVAL